MIGLVTPPISRPWIGHRPNASDGGFHSRSTIQDDEK